jgi:hypothetical protein
MVKQRHHCAVVLSSCRAVQGDANDDQSAGAAWPSTAQATKRNALLGRAELEVCSVSPRSTRVPVVATDVAGDVA